MPFKINPFTGKPDIAGIVGPQGATGAQGIPGPGTSTGLIAGGEVTINGGDAAKFDIASGSGVVVNMTDPYNPVVTEVVWTAFTAQTVTGLAIQPSTVVGIDSAGAIYQQSGLTVDETFKRNYIVLATLAHPGGTAINSVLLSPYVSTDSFHSLTELAASVGDMNKSGNVISANGANLSINKSSGTFFAFNRNFYTNPTIPNTITSNAQTLATFIRAYRNTPSGAVQVPGQTFIDPTKYDDGSGTLAAVPAGKWTVQKIYITPTTGQIFVIYGQYLYNTMQAAVSGLSNDSFAAVGGLLNNFLLGHIVVAGNATDLSDSTQAEIHQSNKFGLTDLIGVVGIPPNGNTGQALVKSSSNPYESGWQTVDSTFVSYPTSGTPSDGSNVQSIISHMWATGLLDRGSPTNNGDGTISIAECDFVVREGTLDDSNLKVCEIAASGPISCTANDVTYIYLDYNAGSPIWATTNLISGFNGIDKTLAFVVARNDSHTHIFSLREANVNVQAKIRRKDLENDNYNSNGFARSSIARSPLTGSGLNVLVGEGKYFFFNNIFTHDAFTTVTAGTAELNVFIRWHNRLSWTQTADQKLINVTQYDNAGTLTAFGGGPGHFRTDWVYVVPKDFNNSQHFHIIMGNADYTTLAAAQAAPQPSSLPPHWDGVGILVGQITVQKDAATFTAAQAGVTAFSGSVTSDHGSLSGLEDNDHPQYQLDLDTLINDVNRSIWTDASGVVTSYGIASTVSFIGAAKLTGAGQSLTDTKFTQAGATVKDWGTYSAPGSTTLMLSTAAAGVHVITMAGTSSPVIRLMSDWDDSLGTVARNLEIVMHKIGLGSVIWNLESGGNTPQFVDGAAPTFSSTGTDIIDVATDDAGVTIRVTKTGGPYS